MIIDDYIEYSKTYKLKYGSKCIILMQVGSFYELYSIVDETSEDIYKIADLCNIQISKKNKNIRDVSISNPLMAGFPLYTLKKFTNILLNANYTIVLVEQVSEPPNPERKITEILSPGINLNVENKKSNFMMVLYYEFIDNLPVVGISGIDLSTGCTFVYETGATLSDPEFTNDEVYRVLSSYNPREIIILSDKNYGDVRKSYLTKHLNLSRTLTHFKWDTYEYLKNMSNIGYQNSILEKSFQKKNMLSIIESLNLEKYEYGRLSLCCLIQFAYEHNVDIVKALNRPDVINNERFAYIEYNSALQLNVIGLHDNDKPLIEILNRCMTAFGSRMFKERLLKPVIDTKTLKQRYDDVEYLLIDDKYTNVNKYLCKIIDLERIKRKMFMNKLHPQDWYGFHTSVENAIVILETYYSKYDVSVYEEMVSHYDKILDLDNASKYNLSDIKGNIFKRGIFKEIDDYEDEFQEAYEKIVDINKKVNNIGLSDTTSCKIDFTDKDGYFITMTKRRYEAAKARDGAYMKQFQMKTLPVSTVVKMANDEISMASRKMEELQHKISREVLMYYQIFVSEFVNKYDNSLSELVNILSNIDISCCNAKNACEFKYYRPEIVESDASFVDAKNLRHPIIERIGNIHYVGNDVCLSHKNKNGMLLYGINASGKSSLMKAIGLNIIMAQCGMFVPCTSFSYYPYNHIFTRISGMDNIYTGMSSFTVEMSELRNILQRCDKFSLVLGDEVCSGTEATSALAIVAAGIDTLVKKKAAFVFATHLHD